MSEGAEERVQHRHLPMVRSLTHMLSLPHTHSLTLLTHSLSLPPSLTHTLSHTHAFSLTLSHTLDSSMSRRVRTAPAPADGDGRFDHQIRPQFCRLITLLPTDLEHDESAEPCWGWAGQRD